jgi:hypothetical protein
MQYVDVHLIARWQSLIEEKYLDYIKKKPLQIGCVL